MKKVIGIIIVTVGIILVAIYSLIMLKDHISVSAIGGVDGPTAVFVAGKVNDSYLFLVGIILFVVGFLIIKKKR